MKIRTRYALKYEDGRYLSTSPDRFPLSHIEWDARRFYSNEDIAEFMRTSPYRPELCGLDSEKFEICEFELTIREVEPDGQGGDSETTSRAVPT